jgi:hypothetical protein
MGFTLDWLGFGTYADWQPLTSVVSEFKTASRSAVLVPTLINVILDILSTVFKKFKF